jgi:hypothetical protein
MDLTESISQLQECYYIEKDKIPTIEELIKQKNITCYIPVRWLTMVFSGGICQVCKNPEGQTHTYILNYKCNYGEDKNGFIVCGKEECNFYITTYRDKLYQSLHHTKKWKELLVKRANNSFVSVTRSNGISENDWSLCTNDEKTTSVYDIVMILILCCKKQNITIPSDIFEYIYKMLVNLYNDDIHLTFENILNRDNKLIMTTLVRIFKGELCKKVPIDLL